MGKTLLIFIFQTVDDVSAPTWEVAVAVDAGKRDCDSIEDSIASYVESIGLGSQTECKKAVEEVMNTSGFQWAFVDRDITGCSTLRTIII